MIETEFENRYNLLSVIGAGTFGEVYKACSASNPNIVVAIKVS